MIKTSENRRALKNKPKGEFAEPANRQDAATARPDDRLLFLGQAAGVVGRLFSTPGGARLTPTMKDRRSTRRGTLRTSVAVSISLLCGAVAANQGNGPIQLRQFIDQRVDGIEKLMVPARDSDLPQPLLPSGSPDPRFQTTEAKRYLGKLLFHDPVRTARILPEYGGVVSARQTGSCGACHLGEVASRAGTIINLNVGGEGRGFTDASGTFIPRRRIQPGLEDTVPTLTEVCISSASINCAFPSHGLTPATDLDVLTGSGRADAVDSVARNVPSIIGFAFSNRLLLGGLTGDPAPFPIGVNPNNLPAGENLSEATNSVHRMFQAQSAELRRIPAYGKLFRDAFPEEAATASAGGNLRLLINAETIFRAMATFQRTVVTRNTPWDRFLAGDNTALTVAQRRGANLLYACDR